MGGRGTCRRCSRASKVCKTPFCRISFRQTVALRAFSGRSGLVAPDDDGMRCPRRVKLQLCHECLISDGIQAQIESLQAVVDCITVGPFSDYVLL